MKRTIIMCLLLLFVIMASAQTISIFEQVTHQAIPLVTISDAVTRIGVVTNTKGQADLSDFRNCEKIEIRCVGYKSLLLSYKQIEEAGFKLFLSEDKISLNTIVISANKWQQPRREVPSKITSIQQREILFLNPQTAADLINSTGEVFMQKSQLGGGSPMIRGFATNRLLISVDGVRMNNAIFRSGNLQNIISIDPFAVERAEVIFGPGSVIYGSDAIAGAMNFFTPIPLLAISNKPLIKGSVLGRYSSANFEKTGHFDLNIGLKKWGFFTSFSYSDYDDLKMGSKGPDEYLCNKYVVTENGSDSVVSNATPLIQKYSAYSQYNILQKIRFVPNPNWDLNYSFYYSATSDYGRYDRLIRPKGGTLRSAEWKYGPQIWMMNHLSINNKSESVLYDNLCIHLSHQYFKESRYDRDLNKPQRHVRIEEVNAYSANIDLKKELAPKHSLHYGAEFVYNKIGSFGREEDVVTGVSEEGATRYPNGSDWASMAAYASYRYSVSDKFSLQAGGRYNYYLLNASFDTTYYPFPFTTANVKQGALTGSLGFVYSPAASWQIILNGSTGFRSPNIDDIGKVFDSSPGTVIIPNPELDAEYAYNVDLALTKTFGDFLKIDITGFYSYLNNAMVRRNTLLNGQDSIMYDAELSQVQSLQNAAFAYVYGFQALLEIKLPFGLGFSSHFNYQKGVEELDDGSTAPLRHAAPMYGSAHLSYSMDRMKLDFYTIFNSEVSFENLAPEEQGKDYIYAIDGNGNPYSPSWFSLNFKALYQISENISATAGIENILDKRYRPYSSGICAPGRNLIISVRAAF